MYMDKDKIVYYQRDLDQESVTSEQANPKYQGIRLPKPRGTRGSTISLQYGDGGDDSGFCHLDFSKITDDCMELNRI